MATSLSSSRSFAGGCFSPSYYLPTWASCSFSCCYIPIGSSCSPIIVGSCILVTTHFLPNIQIFSFTLASLYFNVILPKFKLLERGTWTSTLTTICLCKIFLASLTFVGYQTLLKIVLSRLSTCIWILMIFAFATIIICCVVLASFSCLLISLSFSTTSFCITFWHKMPKYWFNVTTWDLEWSTNGSIPLVFIVDKLGSNNMLAIGNTCGVRASALWTSIVSIVGSWAKLASTSSSWAITSFWVRLTRQRTLASMLVSLDLCIHVVTCSYLGSWT